MFIPSLSHIYITPVLWLFLQTSSLGPLITTSMHSSTTFLQSSPTYAKIHCSCDKVYHKQEVHFLLYILCQIVTWQYIISLIHWIKINHVMLWMIMIDSCETVHYKLCFFSCLTRYVHGITPLQPVFIRCWGRWEALLGLIRCFTKHICMHVNESAKCTGQGMGRMTNW